MSGDRTKRLARWVVLGAIFTLAALIAAGAFLGVFRRDGPYHPRTTPASAPLLVPQAMTVVPGIHMLGGLEPSAAYVVESSDGLILVDSGVDGDAVRLKSQMG